jgi:hypothetical protein
MRVGGRPQDLNSSCALMWPGNDGSCPDASWQLLAAQRARFLAGSRLEESYSMPTEYSAPLGPSADTKNVSTSKQPTCQSCAGGESQSAVPTLCGFVCMAGAELRRTKVKPRSLSFLAVPFFEKIFEPVLKYGLSSRCRLRPTRRDARVHKALPF